MTGYFVVRRARGPAWDHSRERRQQAGWDEHAAYMDALHEQGIAVLVGPLGDGDGHDALAVIRAASEDEVRRQLAADPWGEDMLVTLSVERWNVLLGSIAGA